jgi:hypothetical protein
MNSTSNLYNQSFKKKKDPIKVAKCITMDLATLLLSRHEVAM